MEVNQITEELLNSETGIWCKDGLSIKIMTIIGSVYISTEKEQFFRHQLCF